MKSFKSDLRCVLLASKRGVRIDQLPRCYKELTSKPLYYNRNRFSSLESFLESMPDTCQLTRFNDQVFVTGVPTSNQNDLQQLISRQKTDKQDLGKPFIPRTPAPFRYHSPGGGQFARHSPSGHQNRVHRPYDRRYSSRCTDGYEERPSRARSYRSEDVSGPGDRPMQHSSSAGDSRSESSGESREASRSGSRTRSDRRPEFEPRGSSASRNDFRSRSGSRGGSRSKDHFRSTEHEYERSEERALAEQFNANDPSEFQADQHRSSKASSTGSLDKKAKFGDDELFKLTLDIKTIDTDSVDYKGKLAKFVEEQDLSAPIYSTTTHQHGDQVVYFSKLQIGNRNFVTFPDCYSCEKSAEHAAAKIALDKLNALLCLPSSSDSASESEDYQIESIVRLFNEKEDLILSDHLEKRYYEVYHQNLFANWLDLIKSSSWFSVDETRVGQKSFFSVSLAKPAAKPPVKQSAAEQRAKQPTKQPMKQSTEQSVKIRQVDTNELSDVEDWNDEVAQFEVDDWEDTDEEVLMNGGVPLAAIDEVAEQGARINFQVETEEELGFAPEEETRCTSLDEVAITSDVQTSDSDNLRLPFSELHTILELPSELELPADRDWTVHVLEATESGNLMLRLADNYPQLVQLTKEMTRFYVKQQRGELKKLVKGNVYAAVFGETVFRVQLLQLLPDGKARCRFLDDGVVELAYCCNLFEIDRHFLRLPWQSFHAKLDGIRPDQLTKFAPLIRLFIELKMLEHQNQLYLVARPTCQEPVTVRLFDTSHPDHDLELNKLLIDFLSQK